MERLRDFIEFIQMIYYLMKKTLVILKIIIWVDALPIIQLSRMRNGNIENGDYIQSSDLLGYDEKQDDDFLHNYTIAKATIDCNFELDSPYYQCHEIENGVRVAFITCSYHCG